MNIAQVGAAQSCHGTNPSSLSQMAYCGFRNDYRRLIGSVLVDTCIAGRCLQIELGSALQETGNSPRLHDKRREATASVQILAAYK
jgi:hypothetical protein